MIKKTLEAMKLAGDVIVRQEAEIERLRARLGPVGLEVIEIDGAGHYVNEKVKAEIERLRSIIAELRMVLEAIRVAEKDNDTFRIGQYVRTALAKAKA